MKIISQRCVRLLLVSAIAIPMPLHQARAAPNASYSFENGNALLQDCGTNVMKCLGYVQAVIDTLASGNVINGYHACIPGNLSGQQVMDIASQYLRNAPQDRHRGASGLAADAFSKAFPCQ